MTSGRSKTATCRRGYSWTSLWARAPVQPVGRNVGSGPPWPVSRGAALSAPNQRSQTGAQPVPSQEVSQLGDLCRLKLRALGSGTGPSTGPSQVSRVERDPRGILEQSSRELYSFRLCSVVGMQMRWLEPQQPLCATWRNALQRTGKCKLAAQEPS